MSIFRPWGHINWLLDRLNSDSWSLIACCSGEPRSIALANHLGRERFHDVEIVTIQDPDPNPLDKAANNQRLVEHRNLLYSHGYQADEIRDMELLAGLDATRNCVERRADNGATSIIIDITSLPKIWFFPIIRTVLEDNRFNDVVVTYTSASGYPKKLSGNLGPLKALPGFYAENGRDEHESIIVGIGFEPTGLVTLLKNQQAERIRLVFPFPSGPLGHWRNWAFVKQIEDLTEKGQINPPDLVHSVCQKTLDPVDLCCFCH